MPQRAASGEDLRVDLNLTGRKALITGGSKGIGLAIAKSLAAEGCDLHLAARTQSELEKVAEELRARHGIKVAVHPADLSDGESARALAAAVGDLDILVNSAGGIPRGTLLEIDEERWRKAWDLKVFGTINLTRAVYGPDVQTRQGRDHQHRRALRRPAGRLLHRRQQRQCGADHVLALARRRHRSATACASWR